jgi:uncharacterized Zn-finger protein
MVALMACQRGAEQQAPVSTARETPVNAGQLAAPAIPPPATGPDARTPLGEAESPIDPKSVEAAGRVVQHYGALIEQHRLAEAAKLWGNGAAAADFARQLDHPHVHLEIGRLGEAEGAAGSIYTTVPVLFYGDRFRREAKMFLRRVNDVPGSTEAQRRWHIERIDWKDV